MNFSNQFIFSRCEANNKRLLFYSFQLLLFQYISFPIASNQCGYAVTRHFRTLGKATENAKKIVKRQTRGPNSAVRRLMHVIIKVNFYLDERRVHFILLKCNPLFRTSHVYESVSNCLGMGTKFQKFVSYPWTPDSKMKGEIINQFSADS